MVETIKLESPKTELLTIMRWEDDGGKIIETNHLMLDPPFAQSVLIHGALQNISPPWNQQFVSGPFQTVAGMRLKKRKTPRKKLNRPSVAKHTDRRD